MNLAVYKRQEKDSLELKTKYLHGTSINYSVICYILYVIVDNSHGSLDYLYVTERKPQEKMLILTKRNFPLFMEH